MISNPNAHPNFRHLNNSSSMNFMQGSNTFQEQHESLDNLYTLKKV